MVSQSTVSLFLMKLLNNIDVDKAYANRYGDPDFTDVVARREHPGPKLLMYLYWFTPAIIGNKKWRMKAMTENYSDLVTVSDEAYLYLMVKGNYSKWMYMKNRNVSATSFGFENMNKLTTITGSQTSGSQGKQRKGPGLPSSHIHPEEKAKNTNHKSSNWRQHKRK